METTITYRLLLFFCLFSASLGHAQDFTAINYTIEDGLPSNEVYTTIQDADGFLWIGTDHGVARFDGREFEVFTTSDGLPDNTVFEFYEDHKGRLWFLTFNGKLGFYFEGKFYKIPKLIPSNSTYPSAIKVTSEDSLFVFAQSYSNGYASAKLDGSAIKKGSVRVHKAPDWDGHDVRDRTNSFNSKEFVSALLKTFRRHTEIMMGGHTQFMRGIGLSDSSILFINSTSVIYTVDKYGALDEYIEFDIREPVNDVSRGKDDIYICRNNSLERRPIHNITELAETILLPDIIPSNVLIDRDGGMWVSSLNHGIYYRPAPELSTLKLAARIQNRVELAFALRTENGILTAAKDGAVYFLSKDGVKNVGNSSGIQVQNCGRFGENWYFSNVKETQFYSSSGLLLPQTHSFNLDSHVYGGFEYEFYKGDTITQCKVHLAINGDSYWLEGVSRASSSEIVNDTLWIGAKNGLFAFDLKTRKQIKPDLPAVLRNRITDLTIIDGYLLCATRGNGILIYDRKNNVYQITLDDGLPSNSVKQLLVDGNRIWLSTNSGLGVITVSSLQPFRYEVDRLTKEDGILTRGIDFMQLQGDSLYVLSDGIHYSLPSTYVSRRVVPRAFISSIKVNNKTVPVKREHQLNYDQNDVNIELRGIYFPDAENLNFQYSIDGGATWKITSGSTILLPNLSPGSYNILVKAITPKGVESEVLRTVLVIHPPFWSTWWFYLIVAILVLVVIGVITLVYIRRTRLKSQLVELELRALRSQMNPHFTFNTLNSIQHYVLKKDPDEALEFIGKFSRLIRMVLSNSSQQLIPIQKELEAVETYMKIEQMRLEHKFDYKILLGPGIDPEFDRIPSMIVQPYVENAIWHGLMNKEEGGTITIEVQLEENMLVISIEDDGVGRERSREINRQRLKDHESVGMKISGNRIELINASLKGKRAALEIRDLKDADGKPVGTKVIIRIPNTSEK